jgi:nucleoside-diphosphate-sugar epimerase
MRVLVVGGAGYVGGAITDILNDYNEHFSFKVYDSLLYEESYLKKVPFVYGDVRDTDLLKKSLKDVDAVIWLAAIVGDGACAVNPDVSVAVNQLSVKWLAENFDGRIIYPSSCSVYGAQDAILDETSSVKPLSIYASTKYEAEKYLKDKDAFIFRLGTLFGVGDEFSRIRMDLVVNTLTLKAFTDRKLTVFGGDQFRPLLHVKDIAKTMVEALTQTATGTYNLLCQNVRISDLAYQVRNHFPDVTIEQTPMLFEDSRNYRVSNAKAKEFLNFKTAHTIDDGIDEVKYLLETSRLKDVGSSRYSNHLHLSKLNF